MTVTENYRASELNTSTQKEQNEFSPTARFRNLTAFQLNQSLNTASFTLFAQSPNYLFLYIF